MHKKVTNKFKSIIAFIDQQLVSHTKKKISLTVEWLKISHRFEKKIEAVENFFVHKVADVEFLSGSLFGDTNIYVIFTFI